MRMTDFDSNVTILTEFGKRLKKYRISVSKTQEDLSEYSGVSLGTIKGIESGKSCSVDSLIKILKALRLMSNFNNLIPDTDTSPIDIRTIGRDRMRAVRTTKHKGIVIWGEDK